MNTLNSMRLRGRTLYTVAAMMMAATPLAAQNQNQAEKITLEKITVLSVPFQQSARDIISTTHMLDADALADLTGQPLGTGLRHLAGIDVASHGPAVGRPVIRGQSGYRIGVLEDGLQTGDMSQTANDHANSGAVFGQSRIEVLKGPASLRYGPYAATGIINSFSRALDTDTAPTHRVTVGFDTVADTTQGGVTTRQSFGAYQASLSAFAQDAGNIRIPTHAESAALLAEEGETAEDVEQDAENSFAKADMVHFGLTREEANQRYKIMLGQNSQEYGIVGHEHHDEHAAQSPAQMPHEEEEEVRLDMQKRFGVFIFERDTGAADPLAVKLAYHDYEHTEYEGDRVGAVFAREQSQLNFEMPVTLRPNSDALWGATALATELSMTGAEAFLPDVTQNQFSLYLIENSTFGANDNWQLELAARADHTDYKTAQHRRDFDTLNVAAGLGVSVADKHFIGGSLSFNARPPAPTELFSEGVHTAVQRYERGAPYLKSENSVAGEIYFRTGLGAGEMVATLFNNDYDRFIFLTETGEQKDGEHVFAYRQSAAEISGVEVSYNITQDAPFLANTKWTGDITYARMTGEQKNGTPLRDIPAEKWVLSAGLVHDMFDLQLDIIATSAQNRVPDDQLPTPDYVQADLTAHWHPPALAGLRLSLAVENMLDEEIRHHSSALKDLLPEAGRNVTFRISQHF